MKGGDGMTSCFMGNLFIVLAVCGIWKFCKTLYEDIKAYQLQQWADEQMKKNVEKQFEGRS